MIERRVDDGDSGREARLEALESAVKRLEARIAALEERPTESPRVEPAAVPAAEPESAGAREAQQDDWAFARDLAPSVPVATLLSAAGQACLVLCGAFLLRALTDMDVLPIKLGLALGLAYAVGWLGVTDVLARGGAALRAYVFGASSAVIAYPLTWEAATKFEVVAGRGSAVAIALFSILALGVVWRRDLAGLAWVITVSAVATCFVLAMMLHSLEPFAAVLIVFGVVTVWAVHTRGWIGVQWPAAIAADLFILQMTWIASRAGGPPETYSDLSPPLTILLALALLLAYLASFVTRTLLRQRDVSVFEIVQTAAALLVGLGGAVRVARAIDAGTSLIAGGALIVALACYAVAFSQAKLRWEHRRNFMFYAWLAFVLALAGCHLVAEGLPVLLACSVLAVGGAVLGDRFRRVTLHYHSAAYLLAAAYTSGLAAAGLERFLLPASEPWPGFSIPRLLVLAAAVVCYVIVGLASVDPRRPRSSRIPRVIIAAVAVLGCGGVLVEVVVNTLGSGPPEASPALVAAVRTVVLAASAVGLAATGRYTVLLELRWLVYPVLLCGGLKLVLEDLPHGTPGSLFVAFGAYGLSLIVSPRLVRAGDRGTRGEEPAKVPQEAGPGNPEVPEEESSATPS